MYSNEAERAHKDTYDDFNLKKTLCSPWFIRKTISALRFSCEETHGREL